MYRFNPKIQEALAKVKNGELGEIYSVEAHMDCKHPAEVRQWLQNFPGGMMFFLGCHLIDLIYQIQGEPKEIIPFNCSTGYDEVTANDYGMVVFNYKNGVSFAKTCANEIGGFLRRQLVICGTKGTIEIKPLEVSANGGQYTVMNEVYSTEWHKEWDTSKSDVYGRYDDMMHNFAEMVRGKENRYSYDYELGLYKLILRSCGKEV
jgi:predicted dehydrogenase